MIPVAHGDDLAARIRTAAKDRQVTAVLDNYAGYEALAAELGVPAGRFVSSERRRETELRFYLAPGDDREARTMLADIAELVATWGIRVLISGFYAFDQLPEALADLEARHSRGKVIVGMHTSAPAATYLGQKLRSVHACRSVEQVVPHDDRVAAGADADRRDARAAHRLEREHVVLRVLRQVVERAGAA